MVVGTRLLASMAEHPWFAPLSLTWARRSRTTSSVGRRSVRATTRSGPASAHRHSTTDPAARPHACSTCETAKSTSRTSPVATRTSFKSDTSSLARTWARKAPSTSQRSVRTWRTTTVQHRSRSVGQAPSFQAAGRDRILRVATLCCVE